MTNKPKNRPRQFPTKKHLAAIEAAKGTGAPTAELKTTPSLNRFQKRKLARLSYGAKKPLGGII